MSFEFDVSMSCGGCSGAIERVLTKAKANGEVSDFAVSLQDQSATVTPATASYEDILAKIRKTGKAVNYGKNGDAAAEAYTDLGKGKLDGSIPKAQFKLD